MLQTITVPALIFASGAFMAAAWIGHLRFQSATFITALAASWAIVLPEYLLNVFATRMGHGRFTGAQMAAFHLASGVLCVALVSRFWLKESISTTNLAGLVLLIVAMGLVLHRST
jgi:uncharacterized protein